MSEMVERVARSLCRTNGLNPDDMSEAHNVGGPLWLVFRNDAIDAIAAMREPTEAMGDAGWLGSEALIFSKTNARAVWRAMIDEALR